MVEFLDHPSERKYRKINTPFSSNEKYLVGFTSDVFKSALHGYFLSYGFIELLAKYLEFQNISNICDIGARYGETSWELSGFFPNASIYAFEPNSYLEGDFKNIKKTSFPMMQNVKWIGAALDSENSQKTFHQTADDPGTYSLLETNPNHPTAKSWGKMMLSPFDKVVVPTLRLDSFCQENNISKIDILWIDVQGFEENVLIGCGSILDDVKAIHVETSLKPLGQGSYLNSSNFKTVNQLLAAKGFRLMAVISADFIDEGDLIYLNKKLL